MIAILIILSACLFIILLFVTLKNIQVKRELRRLISQSKKCMDNEYQQPLKLEYFDKDIVDLAVTFNEHIDIAQALATEYHREGKRLNNVISGISHDFRTPLTSALGYLQLIEKSGELSEENKQYLAIVSQKNKYLKELSDEFFELTKFESDENSVQLEKINMSNLISEQLLQQYSWIEQRGLDTFLKIEDGIIMEINQHYAERIIDNIFSNSKKYAKRKLSVTFENKSEKIVLTIENDIDSADEIDVARVFDTFYRGVSHTKNGSGLGLYVVKCLCDKLGLDAAARLENGLFAIIITKHIS